MGCNVKVSKFNSAFYGILSVVIPYQLIELHNFPYLNISTKPHCITNTHICGQTAARYSCELKYINKHTPA